MLAHTQNQSLAKHVSMHMCSFYDRENIIVSGNNISFAVKLSYISIHYDGKLKYMYYQTFTSVRRATIRQRNYMRDCACPHARVCLQMSVTFGTARKVTTSSLWR